MIELDTLGTDEAQADAAAQRDQEEGRGQVWRSFADWRGDERLEKRRGSEFMKGASDPPTKASRRSFMKVMGASMAMAGLAACRRPEEHILPYARKPEQQIPSVPRFYATAMPFRGVSRGLLVQSSDGRPTKIEGNPEHPLTQGATSGFGQGSILNLFDPWRSKTIRQNGSDATLDNLLRQLGQLRGEDTRLAVLMEQTSSPAIARMRERLREAYPSVRWVAYAPEGDDPERMGMQQVTGRPARPLYRFDQADVIASLDADFLSPTRRDYVSNTRTFAAGRRLESPDDDMSRLYAVESGFSLTGGQADHRLAARPTKIAAFARALAAQMGAGGVAGGNDGSNATLTEREQAFAEEMASDLQSAGERGVVLAGEAQPPAVHALAMRLNQQLGATGTTVHLMDTGEQQYTPLSEKLTRLVSDMRGGNVDALAVIGANPLYDLPRSMGFREAMGSVSTTVHAGLRRNETAQAADWHVPRAHYLESWGDGRAYDGTVSLRQPLIKPLYEDAMSELELLHALATGRRRDGYDLLLAQYQERAGANGSGQGGEGSDFDEAWRRALHRGYLPGTQYEGAPTGEPNPASRSDQGASQQPTAFSGLSFAGSAA
ncbi:MAG: hydrogenase, partial [Bacteroidetes bacterium QS_9_68_14]